MVFWFSVGKEDLVSFLLLADFSALASRLRVAKWQVCCQALGPLFKCEKGRAGGSTGFIRSIYLESRSFLGGDWKAEGDFSMWKFWVTLQCVPFSAQTLPSLSSVLSKISDFSPHLSILMLTFMSLCLYRIFLDIQLCFANYGVCFYFILSPLFLGESVWKYYRTNVLAFLWGTECSIPLFLSKKELQTKVFSILYDSNGA